MKLVGCNLESRDLFVSHLNRGLVAVGVERGLHEKAGARRRRGNQIDDGLVADQRFAALVLRDETEQSMLNLVPLAGAGREMADRQRQIQFVGQGLQRPLPEP